MVILFWSSEGTEGVGLFHLSYDLFNWKKCKSQRKKDEAIFCEWPGTTHVISLALAYSSEQGPSRHQTLSMFWGCGNDRAGHGFSAKADEPLGNMWSTGWTKAALGLWFSAASVHCSLLQIPLIWARTPQDLPEARSAWEYSAPWHMQRPEALLCSSLLKLMACHHRVKSNLMREISQWEIH